MEQELQIGGLVGSLHDPGPSAADLKFLQHLPQNSSRNFKSKSGTRIINLPVPLCFRSSCRDVLQSITNFESGALVMILCAGSRIRCRDDAGRPRHSLDPCSGRLGLDRIPRFSGVIEHAQKCDQQHQEVDLRVHSLGLWHSGSIGPTRGRHLGSKKHSNG